MTQFTSCSYKMRLTSNLRATKVNYACVTDLSIWRCVCLWKPEIHSPEYRAGSDSQRSIGDCNGWPLAKPLGPFESHDHSRPLANSPPVRNLKKLNDWAFLIAVGALVLMCILICVVARYGSETWAN